MPELVERASGHQYLIQSHESYFFWAGRTKDRTQVLMGLACPYLVGFFFDLGGNLIGVQKRHLEFLQPSGVFVDGEPIQGQVKIYDIYDEEIPIRLDEWQQEIGFQEQIISVKRFADPAIGIGIRDYPEHFAEVLSDPEASEEEKEGVLESLPEWEADGQFVLWWGNDYWLNGDGEVTSS
jgi:hypothetical protein